MDGREFYYKEKFKCLSAIILKIIALYSVGFVDGNAQYKYFCRKEMILKD